MKLLSELKGNTGLLEKFEDVKKKKISFDIIYKNKKKKSIYIYIADTPS